MMEYRAHRDDLLRELSHYRLVKACTYMLQPRLVRHRHRAVRIAGLVISPAGPTPQLDEPWVVELEFCSRLTQGPAVVWLTVTTRYVDMLTMTRSAHLQVRCTVVALWSEHPARYALQIRLARAELDRSYRLCGT